MQHTTELPPPVVETDGVSFVTIIEGDPESIGNAIELLIAKLDAMEPDPDLEPYLAGCHGGDRMIDLEGGDGYEGDCDREPSLGWACNGQMGRHLGYDSHDLEDDTDDEASLGWGQGSQAVLHVDTHDEAEQENEHGGDIQDEPHDALDEGNDEPFLGWSETCGQGPKVGYKNDPAVQCLDHAPDPNDLDSIGCYQRGGPLDFDGSGYREGKEMLRDLQHRRPDVHQGYVRVIPGLW